MWILLFTAKFNRLKQALAFAPSGSEAPEGAFSSGCGVGIPGDPTRAGRKAPTGLSPGEARRLASKAGGTNTMPAEALSYRSGGE